MKMLSARAVAARLGWLGVAVAAAAPAAPVDATVHQRLRVGPPPGAAPLERVDSLRSGRSRWALPDRPRLLWRTRLPAPLVSHLAVDDRFRALAVTQTGDMIQLDAQGAIEWTARTSGAGAASGPFITSDGLRGFVTRSGELLLIDRRGRIVRRLRFESAPSTPARSALAAAHVLVRSDGNLVVALGSDLFQVGQGEIEQRASVAEPVAALLEIRGASVIATTGGRVLEWWPPSLPRELGSFGGTLDGGASSFDAERLVANVDRSRVVLFDLARRRRELAFSDPTLSPLGPPALVRPGALRFLTREGVLIARNSASADAVRVPLDVQAPPIEAAPGPAAPPLVDAQGRTAVARAGEPLLVVHADGRLEPAAGTECAEPLALVPAGEQRLLLACRDGTVALIGNAPQ